MGEVDRGVHKQSVRLTQCSREDTAATVDGDEQSWCSNSALRDLQRTTGEEGWAQGGGKGKEGSQELGCQV